MVPRGPPAVAFHSPQVLGSGPQICFEQTGLKLPKRGRASSVPYGAAFGPRAREPVLLVNKRATSGVLEFQGVSWRLTESRRRSIDSIPGRALQRVPVRLRRPGKRACVGSLREPSSHPRESTVRDVAVRDCVCLLLLLGGQ